MNDMITYGLCFYIFCLFSMKNSPIFKTVIKTDVSQQSRLMYRNNQDWCIAKIKTDVSQQSRLMYRNNQD